MGFFDFVKDAGKKLLGKDDAPKAPAPTAAGAAPAEDLMNAHKARALKRIVRDLDGIDIENLDISVDGDVATVRGKASSKQNKEKVVLAVGNVAGIARVDDRLELGEDKEAEKSDAKFYTVKSGDSLSKIAKEHYGNAMKYPVIFEANKPMLSDPDKIYPGQVLRIPAIED